MIASQQVRGGETEAIDRAEEKALCYSPPGLDSLAVGIVGSKNRWVKNWCSDLNEQKHARTTCLLVNPFLFTFWTAAIKQDFFLYIFVILSQFTKNTKKKQTWVGRLILDPFSTTRHFNFFFMLIICRIYSASENHLRIKNSSLRPITF